jgi:conjugative relaxase-like TrwC/TraI family protein
MLTLRKITVASGDAAAARRAAAYLLDVDDSPAVIGAALDGVPAPTEAVRPLALWLGTPSTLRHVGVDPHAPVERVALARAFQGRHAQTGARIRTEGLILKEVPADDGHPARVRVRGTKSVDLTFSAPKSVSVVWSQAGPETRRAIERGMVVAAEAMLGEMTLAKPVVAHQRTLHPAHGFAAAAALHVKARASEGDTIPSPQLHVHAVVVGVERSDGFFASPELSGMFRNGAPLEGGAVARARLAEALVDHGFAIDQDGRYFAIRGVSPELVERMSSRTRDVQADVERRAAQVGRPLTNLERSVAALRTRGRKSTETTAAETAAAWRAQARHAGFARAAVDALLGTGTPLDPDTLPERRAATLAAPAKTTNQRAALLERAAGRLRLTEAYNLLGEQAAAAQAPAA